MMNNFTYTLVAIIVISIITFGTRLTPFIFFPIDKPIPKFIVYIGTYLPPAVIAMLIIYSVRNVSLNEFPFGLPEFIGILVVALIHRLKKNYLLSIVTGTLAYMLIVQLVF